MATTLETGFMAEEAAAAYLARQWFTILHRNWRHGRYELDIVAEKGGDIHFVEVKCRRRHALTAPEQAAGPAKFRALQKAAEAWLEAFGTQGEVQFDVVAVEYDDSGMDIRYIPDALRPSW